MQDQYSFLNGVLTEFKDGGLQLRVDPNPPATESVLILGTAVDGPILEPVAVDASTVYQLFGKATSAGVPNGSTLVQAFEEAYKNGCRDVRLMRISGTKATGQVTLPTTTASYEVVEEEYLGTKSGNNAITFTVSHMPIVGNITVYAQGVQVAPDAFTVVPATGKVNLKANTVDANAAISIKYSYDQAGTLIEVTENNDGALPPVAFVAAGSDQVFALTYTPNAGTLSVIADGSDLTVTTDYTIVANSLSLKANVARLGAEIEVSYARTVTEAHTPALMFESVFGGTIYNQTQVSVEAIKNVSQVVIGKKVVIKKPAIKQNQLGEPALVYSSIDFPTFAQLVQAVNGDPSNNVIKLMAGAQDEFAKTVDLMEQYPINLTGGSDGLGLTRLEKFQKLDQVYHLLENYLADSIVVTGVYADEDVPGQKHDMPFAYQMALACGVISQRGHRVTGYIQTASPAEPGLAAVEAHTVHLESKSMSFNMRDKFGNEIADAEGVKIDLGGYLVVFAGPDMVINASSRGIYGVNSAAGLAGFVSTLLPEQAPTNKVMTEVMGLRYTYGLPQANRLVKKRYTILKGKRLSTNPNAIVVAIEDAPTAAAATSDWARLSTVRSVKVCVDDVKDAADAFIGQPNTLDKRNAFASAMAKKLDARKQAGTIGDYGFRIIFTQADLIMGQLKVELDIVPQFELRKITQVVGLTPNL